MKKIKVFAVCAVMVMTFSFTTYAFADPITGSGTIDRISKFSGATNVIGDSLLSDDGVNTTLTSGNLFLQIGSAIDSLTNGILNFGTTNATTLNFGRSGQHMIINSKVGIGTTTPGAALHVNGDFITKGPWADVRAFGAKGDGINDDTAAIQAAINSLTQGGVVLFPPGNYLLTSTLSISTSSISLQGSGSFGNADVGTNFTGTRLTWVGGASTMVAVAPVTGASNQALKRTGIADLSFECAGGASIGLSINSSHYGTFKNLYFKNCNTAAIDMNVVATLGEARDNTKNIFENISIRQLDGTGGSGIGIRMDGDVAANTSNNDFFDIGIVYLNGIAVKMINTDSNRIYGLVLNRAPGGTGIGVELGGSNTYGMNSRGNIFNYTEAGPGGVVHRGTGLAYPADRNNFYAYTQENGAPLPVLEGSANTTYHTDKFWNKLVVAVGSLGLDTATAGTLSIGSTIANAITIGRTGITTTIPGILSWGKAATVTKCTSSASPASCSAAPAGSVALAAAATTLVVNTTAVTAGSQILITEDSSLGSLLGITCNTTAGRTYSVSARTAGTSFTIKSNTAPTTNKACLSYLIIN